jgi:hypothetical protein
LGQGWGFIIIIVTSSFTFLQGIVRSVFANLVSDGDGRSEIGAGAVVSRFGDVRHSRGSQNT